MINGPLPFKLSAPAALRIIRETAQDTSRVIVTTHAKRRMKERRISLTQIIDCLFHGQINEGPSLDTHGSWVCSLSWRHAGDYMKVALAIKHEVKTGHKLIIITVMYED